MSLEEGFYIYTMELVEIILSEQAGGRILKLIEEPVMTGSQQPPSQYDHSFNNVTFGYHEQVLLNRPIAAIKQLANIFVRYTESSWYPT